MSKRIGLALSSGGARGLAHILVLEALDELGLKPTMIAGTGMGALIGAAYAAGLSGREIRAHAGALLRNRADVLERLPPIRLDGALPDAAGQIDPERVVSRFMPDRLPEDFVDLQIQLTVMTTDLYGRKDYPIIDGPLISALAASISAPGLMRPVAREGKLLVEGGAVNPLPIDQIKGIVDVVIASDVTAGRMGDPDDEPRAPNTTELLFSSRQITMAAMVEDKLKASQADVLVKPKVSMFGMLDFLKIGAVLRAAEPVKDALKRALGDLDG